MKAAGVFISKREETIWNFCCLKTPWAATLWMWGGLRLITRDDFSRKSDSAINTPAEVQGGVSEEFSLFGAIVSPWLDVCRRECGATLQELNIQEGWLFAPSQESRFSFDFLLPCQRLLELLSFFHASQFSTYFVGCNQKLSLFSLKKLQRKLLK